MQSADFRFSDARFGPWSHGPIADENEPVVNDTPPPADDPPPTRSAETGAPAGGEAGLGGGGQGGAWGSLPGVIAFDEGGSVDGEQEPQQADPMQMIKAAMQHGRQKLFGMPATLYSEDGQPSEEGSTQSFDGGGVIEDGQQQPQEDPQGQQQQQPPVDPKHTVLYHVGDGALPPDMVQALEQRADPQGAMPEGDRMMKVAQMLSRDPNALFAYLQRKRTDFNGHMGAFQHALGMGNMGLAAHHATEAMSNVPGAHGMKFAPAPGGLAMMGGQSSAQAQPEQPEPEAPQVDDDEPEQVQSAADGGVIATDETNPTALMQAQQGGPQHGYDDGGEVEEGDEAEAVQPTSQVTATVTDPEAPDNERPDLDNFYASRAAATGDQQAAPQSQPVTLTREQAKQLITPATPDKVVDMGSDGWLKSLLGSAWEGIKSIVPGPTPLQGAIADLGGNTPRAPAAPPAGQSGYTPSRQPAKAQPLSMEPEDTPQRQQRIAAMDENIAGQKKAKEQATADAREEEVLKRRVDMIRRIAAKQFPWVGGDAAKREAFEAQMLKQLYGEDAVRVKADSEGKAMRETMRENRKDTRAAAHEAAVTMRNANSTATRMNIEQVRQLGNAWNKQYGGLLKTMQQVMHDNPGIEPEEAVEKARMLVRGTGVNPAQLRDVAHILMNPDLYYGGAAGQQGIPRQGQSQGQQPSGQGSTPAAGGKRYKVNPDNGKVYMYDEQRGGWVLGPGQ